MPCGTAASLNGTLAPRVRSPAPRSAAKGDVDKGSVVRLIPVFSIPLDCGSLYASGDREGGFSPPGSPVPATGTLVPSSLQSPGWIPRFPSRSRCCPGGATSAKRRDEPAAREPALWLGCLGSAPGSAPRVGSAPARAPSPHGVQRRGHPHQGHRQDPT